MKRLLFIVILLMLCTLTLSCQDVGSAVSDSGSKEYYLVPSTSSRVPDSVELTTIKSWAGTQSSDIEYRATKAPWVINSNYTSTSQLSNIFEVTISQETGAPGIILTNRLTQLSDGSFIALIEDTGTFTIHIKASGASWWLKIGVE